MKQRLDVLLVEKGFFQSRERAKAEIMAGKIYIGGRIYDKPGTSVDVDSEIVLRGDTCPFVGRGGYKLDKAIKTFGLDLKGAVCMDVGASTGGFTDVMLQNGASKVYSVDVGYGQLDWKLRTDDRVVNMEKVNFRYFEPEDIDEKLDFLSADVSFISLNLIFPPAVKLMKDDARMVCLIKPQFEAGREQVGKKGIVRDKGVHLEVIEKVAGYALENGLVPRDLSFSPMTGAKGNIEYLIFISKGDREDFDFDAFAKLAESTVEEAHTALSGGK